MICSYSFKISSSYWKIVWVIASLSSDRWSICCCCYCSCLLCVYLLHVCEIFSWLHFFVSCHQKRSCVIVLFAPCRRQLKMTRAVKIQQIGVVTRRVTQTVVMMIHSMPASENVSWRGSVCYCLISNFSLISNLRHRWRSNCYLILALPFR